MSPSFSMIRICLAMLRYASRHENPRDGLTRTDGVSEVVISTDIRIPPRTGTVGQEVGGWVVLYDFGKGQGTGAPADPLSTAYLNFRQVSPARWHQIEGLRFVSGTDLRILRVAGGHEVPIDSLTSGRQGTTPIRTTRPIWSTTTAKR